MRVIVAGSRHYDQKTAEALVVQAVEQCGFSDSIAEVIHGGARGIDAAANVLKSRWPVTVFPADWDRHGKAAGPIRNTEMAKAADALIAIWDGQSRGTADMIQKARAHGLRVFVFSVAKGAQ